MSKPENDPERRRRRRCLFPGPPAQRAAHLRGRLGGFLIQRRIGCGRLCVDHEAEQIGTGRRVLLKLFPFVETLGPDRLHQGLAEARAAASLRHEGLLLPLAVGQERGLACCALPLRAGRPLAALLDDRRRQAVALSGASAASPEEGPRSGRERFRWVAQLGAQAAAALDHAHQQGIIHRDLKPANLFVAPSGRLWVADLGLAAFRGDGWLNTPEDLRGALPYRSPEQALAGDGAAGPLADVHSLGACLYEALTLRPPFVGADWRGLLSQVATVVPRRPRRWCPAIPADLEAIVLRAMSRDPGARYLSAARMADDLRDFLDSKAAPVQRPHPLRRAAAWLRACLHLGTT